MNPPPLEPTVVHVLQVLWDAHRTPRPQEPAASLPMQELLRQTGLALPVLQSALEELTRRHCRIERTPAGIRLSATSLECWRDVLESFSRERQLQLAHRVMVFAVTDSTNNVARQCAGTPGAHGLVVLADEQTAGRGRLGHRWLSKTGQSVLMSVVLRDPAACESPDRLTLLAGLSAAIGIERCLQNAGIQLPQPISIKWPNDLLIADKKIAGILVESHRDPAGPAIILGLGINVAQDPSDFPPDLANSASSLFQSTGILLDRSFLVASILESLHDSLLQLRATDPLNQGGDAWLQQWKRRCGMWGKKINARSGDRLISGEVIDVEPLQGLVLRDPMGALHFLSAQTSSLQ